MKIIQTELNKISDYCNKIKNNGLFSEEDVELVKRSIAEIFNCDAEQVATDDVIFKNTDEEVVPYVVILGNANFCESNISDLGDLQYVGKSIVLEKSNIEDLKNLAYVGKNVYGIKSKVNNFGSLQYVGGNAFFDYQSSIEEEYARNFDAAGNRIKGKTLSLIKK